MSIADALSQATANSPFLARLVARQPELVATIRSGEFANALAEALAISADSTAATLRKRRQGVALVTAIADLAGIWDLSKVTRVLSEFADAALDIAIAAAFTERVPDAPVQGFCVIALGKLGGFELNYSSDIDLIFLYDPKTLPHREREDVADSAVRIGRRVIAMLSERDENDYVFRVDMRLRPASEITPISIAVDAAIGHYESSALAWEQAAFIRARVAAGDRTLGDYFIKTVQPFIWRRNLDFGQIGNIMAMTSQIRDHFVEGQILGPGYDLKRGRGGIRECEFFAQVHQLIHGGRDPALRLADTRKALAALATADHIDHNAALAVSDAYSVLRTIEHRLQMLDDWQTHQLPEGKDSLDRAARLHGLKNGSALIQLLSPHVARVDGIYAKLAGDGSEANRLPANTSALKRQFVTMGYADPTDILRRVSDWRSGKYRAIRSEAARGAFEALLPKIIGALGAGPDPERAIARFDNLLETLPSAINIFHLLDARPGLLSLLVDVLSYAPTLAEALAMRSEYLDGLIDAGALDLPESADKLMAELCMRSREADYQSVLDDVRAFVGEKRFALGVQLIEGRHDPLAISHAYAQLAETAIARLTDAAVAEFEATHGKVPGGELVILALGRLGGEALTHASDLDLVLLFTGDFLAESDGARPLGGTQYFNRLAQRVIAALSVPTAAGALYEVDTRLRPSGAKGLLCASLESFAEYQNNSAWTWEHMALTRARPVYGSANARKAAQQVVSDVLLLARPPAKLRREIVAMRKEMAAHKPAKGPFDIKACAGGLIDAEFLIHAEQLGHGTALHPQLGLACDALVGQKLLPADFARSFALLSRLLILLRLVAPDLEEPPDPAKALLARVLDFENWPALILALEDAKAVVSSAWQGYARAR